MNLFKKHQEFLANQTPAADVADDNIDNSHEIGTDDLLTADLMRIKKTEQTGRDTLKSQLIKKYQEVFDKACEAASWADSRFIFWNIIWRFDIGDIVEAFEIAKIAIERGLTSDSKVFKSSFPTVLVDTIFKWAEQQYKAEASTEPVLSEMVEFLNAGLDINPVPHAKILKLQGDIIRPDNPALALEYFIKANELEDLIGVKTRIKDLKKQLKK